MASIAENLEGIRSRIRAAAEKAGRDPESVRLLAVSKTFPYADAAEAFRSGQKEFGENRVQELETKVPLSEPGMVWHLIGHLQSNKAAKAVELASWIHSIDSLKLMEKIIVSAERLNKRPVVLIEVNISGEESKFGIRTYEDLFPVAELAAKSSAVDFRGLMTMAPLGASPELLKSTFGGLRTMKERLEKDLSIRLPELSMGMSGDFETAIAEGATIVRVGTAIFGGRVYPEKKNP